MADALYDKGRNSFLTGDIDWVNDTIRIGLLDGASYTPDLANHDFFDDLSGFKGESSGTGRADGSPILTPTAVDGVADALDTEITAVAAGPALEYVVCYKDTGVDGTSNLIFLLDSATGLPVTPNGGNITLAWADTANKIFKL